MGVISRHFLRQTWSRSHQGSSFASPRKMPLRYWHDVLSPAGHSGFIMVCGELKPNYFDVLITDHNMPLVSGLELIQHPRFKLEHTFLQPAQSVPLIHLSHSDAF